MLWQQLPLGLCTLSHRTFYTAYTTKAFSLYTLYYYCNHQHLEHHYHKHYQYQPQQLQIAVLTQEVFHIQIHSFSTNLISGSTPVGPCL